LFIVSPIDRFLNARFAAITCEPSVPTVIALAHFAIDLH
jgi:hypothetical protein